MCQADAQSGSLEACTQKYENINNLFRRKRHFGYRVASFFSRKEEKQQMTDSELNRVIEPDDEADTAIPAYTLEARKQGILNFLFRKVLL